MTMTDWEELETPAGDWIDLAECRSADPKLFFPERFADTLEAKMMCARCPVRTECLRYALDNHIVDGLWGGVTEIERRELRREYERSLQPCGLCGTPFSPRQTNQHYCSKRCASTASTRRQRSSQ